MIDDGSQQNGGQRRLWRKGDRSKVSIMQVFRAAYHEHDARKANARNADGETEVTQRSLLRRDGLSEGQLKAHLAADLNALLNTIRLDAAVDLSDVPHVQRSILNYGFRDLSSLSASELNTPDVVNSIRESLLNHEPRLVRESIEVTVQDPEANEGQRLHISVTADLMGDPVDVPLNFDAEIDMAVGKMKMSKLRMQM